MLPTPRRRARIPASPVRFGPWALLLVAALTAACGQDNAAPPTAVAGQDTQGTTDLFSGVFDVGADTDGQTDGGAAPGDSGASDAGSDVAEVKTCEFAANPQVGQPGGACSKAEDCDSGLCVEGPKGKVCTVKCSDCCPTSWKCTQLGDADPVFACLPQALLACQPCEADAECATQGGAGLCIEYGVLGRFCGSKCDDNADCPADYQCQEAKGTKGAGKQCVRTVGDCGCSPKSIAAGLQTGCSVANEFGVCKGTRKCTEAGLTPCNAKTPLAEACNGLDDDCDGSSDEPDAKGCKIYWKDSDGDGFGEAEANGGKKQCLCLPVGLYTASTASDCNDNDKLVKPSTSEICNDIDDDCDGVIDEGCDADGDGWCSVKAVVIGKPKVCFAGLGDCDDDHASAYPGGKETCGNGIDEDCNGQTDADENAKGCIALWFDGDKDGFGKDDPKCLCAGTGSFTATKAGDCLDNDPKANPAASEVCGNGKDDDCDAAQDEPDSQGCVAFFADQDSDGYGTGASKCLCAPDATYTVKKDGDCDDSNAKANPGMTEACNSLDDDCDAKTDEVGALGCSLYYADLDADLYGDPKASACLCKPEPAYSATAPGDCDDSKAAVNPKGKEACDGFDNNCNGVADEVGAAGCTTLYADLDGDGAGDPAQKACMCGKTPPYTADNAKDCDDKNPKVFGGQTEACNGTDDNCNGQTDEEGGTGCSTFYLDSDGDSFGASGASKCLCAPGSGWTASKDGDCNDKAAAIYPGAAEICNNFDDNCNSQIDELNAKGCTNMFSDSDKDGFGDADVSPQCLCKAAGLFTALQGGDCNDNNKLTYPSAKESCDGIDSNCNNVVDDIGALGCTSYFFDNDQDGYGQLAKSQCLCGPLPGYTATQPGDCDDGNKAVKPGAVELCNALDDNCNGITDTDSPDAKKFYVDADGDGFGSGGGQTLCAANSTYKVTTQGDCNDNDGKINPNQTEVCNGKDDNCDASVDNGAATQLCQDQVNSSPLCVSGKCTLKCEGTWFDVDGQYGNGCECMADSKFGLIGTSCANAENLGNLADNGQSTVRLGNIMPGESDWYTFNAVDNTDSGGDSFNVRVKLVSNPDGLFTIDVYRGGCTGSQQICTAAAEHSWSTAFYGAAPSGPDAKKGTVTGDYVKSPQPEQAGEGKCTGAPGVPGMNICANQTAQYYVRVYRHAGAPNTCAYYTVQMSNGL